MTYAEALKKGFGLINKRLQLVAVQAVMMVINCLGFFIMVGIPLGIAFIIFGLDLTGIAELRDIQGLLKNPLDLISKYFGLALIVLSGFLLYILAVSTAGLFVFGGFAGTLGRALQEPSEKFRMQLFFTEAKKIFFPLIRYAFVIGLIFAVIAFVFGLFGGAVSVIVSGAKSQDSTLALFLGIFFSLVLILLGLSIIIGSLAVAVYGIAGLFFKRESAVRTFRNSLRFLWDDPAAFWLYLLLFAGYVFASFILILIGFPFRFIPIVGGIIAFPVQIMSYLVQSYLGLLVLAVIFVYYFEAEVRKPEPVAETAAESTDVSSTPAGDISDLQEQGHEDALPQKDENGPV